MISSFKILNVRTRFLFIANVVIISELVNNYLRSNELFSSTWLYSAFSFLIAYIFYIVLIEDINLVDSKNYKYKPLANDFMRFSTLFLISKIIGNYIEYGSISLSVDWFAKTLLVIAAYILSDFIFMDNLIKLTNNQMLLYDVSKMFLADIIVLYYIFGDYSENDFIDNISFLYGYISWELITKKLLL